MVGVSAWVKVLRYKDVARVVYSRLVITHWREQITRKAPHYFHPSAYQLINWFHDVTMEQVECVMDGFRLFRYFRRSVMSPCVAAAAQQNWTRFSSRSRGRGCLRSLWLPRLDCRWRKAPNDE